MWAAAAAQIEKCTTVLLCFCFAFALLLLCFAFALLLPCCLLCCCFAIALLLLCFCFALLCFCFACALRVLLLSLKCSLGLYLVLLLDFSEKLFTQIYVLLCFCLASALLRFAFALLDTKIRRLILMILLLTHLYLCGVRAESDNVLHFSMCMSSF